MTISKIRRHLLLLAALALPFAGGLCAQTQMYPFEKDGAVFAEGRALPASPSGLSEQIALQKAEVLAQVSLLDHGISKAVKLPPEWEDLRASIASELAKTRSVDIKINGVSIVSRRVLTTGAYCVVSVPSDNLAQAVAAPAAQWNENSILRAISGNKILRFETAQRKSLPANIREIFDPSDDILTAIEKNASVGRLPKLWAIGIDAMDKQQIETWPVPALVRAFNEAVGQDAISAKILGEISNKNYRRVARQLAGLKLPLSTAYAPDETGLAELKARAQAELTEKDYIAKIIVQHDGLLLLKENAVQNDRLIQANKIFSQPPVDFDKVRELAFQSLLKQTSAEAFNLAGRTYEMQERPNLAAFFYFQAHVTNSKNPYAATNLALVFDKLEKEQSAVWWLREASKNDRLPAWSAQKLDSLRSKYQGREAEAAPPPPAT